MLEKHIQTILVTIITAGILFVAIQITTFQVKFGVINHQLSNIEKQLEDVVNVKNKIQHLDVRVSILEENQK